MRKRLLSTLTVLSLALMTRAGAAQNPPTPPRPQLRWELVGDSIAHDWGGSRAAFTLTNRGTKPLPPTGWAIYFNALHSADPGSVGSGFIIEDVIADLHRLAPAASFAGLAPGASIRIPYLTGLLLNRSFVPQGPYIMFDDAKDVGVPLNDYVALPFERPPQGTGHDPRVVTPEHQFTLDSATRPIPVSELPPVFPTPVEVTAGTGTLRLATLPPVEAAEALKNEAAFAAEYLRPYFGSTRKAGGPTLPLEVGPVAGQTSPEAYTLVVDSVQGIHIVGASPAGVLYGLQSLRGLLPAPTPRAGLVLPAVRVVDAPRFGYRGFLLDVARNFHPKAAVLRTLDLIARYKLNVLHLHLTDDEGWRIEIPSLPELTALGARRGHPPDSDRHLPPAFGSGPAVDRPWGSGFLSRGDNIEILRYAAARHIEVIPELEMPGHARAAIKAMQANPQYRLNDPDDRSVYTSAQGYHDNIMNPVLESTYRFIERVVGDLVAMHREAGVPLRHIHMGGDEVTAGVWQGSPAAQTYLKAHDVTSVDELWFVFYGRVAQILKAQEGGLLPSGWEEIAVRKTQRGGQQTNIPNPDFAARGWRGYVDLRKPFDFIPFDYYRNVRVDPSVFVGKDRLTDYGRAHIVGIQGNLWSETLGGEGRLEYMMLPKLFGLAERAWAPDPDWARERDPAKSESLYREAWSRFVNVLGQRELPRLDREVAGVNYRIPTPGLRAQGGVVSCSLELPGFTLRYATDGSEPTVRSALVRGPIPFRGTVRVAAFNSTGRKGHTAHLTAEPASSTPGGR